MIKINLLPVRAVKKKEIMQQQILIAAVSVLSMLLVLVTVYSVTLLKISTAKQEISAAEQEIELLKKKIGEIDNLKKLQAEVKKKLGVLDQLRKQKTGPASRLAKLSGAVPEQLWLTRYAESGADVSISGVAMNEDLIANFMRNLQSSDEFTNVELMVSEQTDAGGQKMKRFDMTCAIKSLKQ
ncbi:PilN domain-containing protein [Geobacter sp. DSM 9736]|uniref:PilN domain-containing protein n=1 Tax=Geobacter sp. DSM 9736 TaxID=1277350 RepID=UPI000B50832D|nr:PilN domain-containing protein [Geobacter sp. DSM 9736]SNB46191.1 type IV pilus assembly protein PilN [Geobacter sp. DSM 9736]